MAQFDRTGGDGIEDVAWRNQFARGKDLYRQPATRKRADHIGKPHRVGAGAGLVL